jgi:hypothetical protein
MLAIQASHFASVYRAEATEFAWFSLEGVGTPAWCSQGGGEPGASRRLWMLRFAALTRGERCVAGLTFDSGQLG